MLSEEDFKYKYLQQPITFLTEENLDKLETHCRKASKIERGVEHKVVLELLDRYYQYQKENKDLKVTINKQSLDISNNLLELQQKDKKIDLMAEYWNTGLAMCDNCDKIVEKYEENTCKECIKQYFETKAKKGE